MYGSDSDKTEDGVTYTGFPQSLPIDVDSLSDTEYENAKAQHKQTYIGTDEFKLLGDMPDWVLAQLAAADDADRNAVQVCTGAAKALAGISERSAGLVRDMIDEDIFALNGHLEMRGVKTIHDAIMAVAPTVARYQVQRVATQWAVHQLEDALEHCKVLRAGLDQCDCAKLSPEDKEMYNQGMMMLDQVFARKRTGKQTRLLSTQRRNYQPIKAREGAVHVALMAEQNRVLLPDMARPEMKVVKEERSPKRAKKTKKEGKHEHKPRPAASPAQPQNGKLVESFDELMASLGEQPDEHAKAKVVRRRPKVLQVTASPKK
jgi:hypothetical protein